MEREASEMSDLLEDLRTEHRLSLSAKYLRHHLEDCQGMEISDRSVTISEDEDSNESYV